MNYLIYFIGLVIATVFGFWLRNAARDELKAGKRWFKVLFYLGLTGILIFGYLHQEAAALTSAALMIIAGISLKRK